MNKRPPIVDPHDDRATIVKIGDARITRQRHRAMRRRDAMHVIALAVRSRPAMEVGPIPGSNPFAAICGIVGRDMRPTIYGIGLGFRDPLALCAAVLRCIGIDETDGLHHARIVRWNDLPVALLVVGSFHALGLPIGLFFLSKHNRFVANGVDRGGVLLALLIGHDGECRRCQGECAGREIASADGITASASAGSDRRPAK